VKVKVDYQLQKCQPVIYLTNKRRTRRYSC